jgi:hypothetical protein
MVIKRGSQKPQSGTVEIREELRRRKQSKKKSRPAETQKRKSEEGIRKQEP